MKTTFKRVICIVLALCLLITSATCLMGIFAVADEATNIALIDDTNEADRNRVIASAEASGTWGYNLFDGNKTDANAHKWWTGGASTGYVILDLGAEYDITRISALAMVSAQRIHTYDVYVLSDLGGIEYKADNKDAIAAKLRAGTKIAAAKSHAGLLEYSAAGTGRYVMIDITSCVTNDANKIAQAIAFSELEIYGTPHPDDEEPPVEPTNVALMDDTVEANRNRVIASAEASGTWGYNLFDGNKTDDNAHKWWTGGASTGYVILDLGAEYDITNIYALAMKTAARIHTYDVYIVSDLGGIEYKADNKDAIAAKLRAGTKIVADKSHAGEIAYSATGTGRYVMIDITSCTTNDANKIAQAIAFSEFEIYGVPHVADDDTSSEESSSEEVSSEETSSEEVSSEVSSEETSSDVSSDTSSETSSDSTSSDDTPSEESNFAQNKNVIASGANSGYGPEKAVDGTTAGRQWMAGGVQTATAWIAVDLGQIRNFNTLKTYLGTGSSGQRKYTYDVYVADTSDFTGEFSDANKTNVFEGIKANGTKVFTVDASNSAAGEVTSIFSAIDGQYVLINFTGCVGTLDASDTISLYELEIFNTSSEDDDTSSDSTSSEDVSSEETSSEDVSSEETSSDVSSDTSSETSSDSTSSDEEQPIRKENIAFVDERFQSEKDRVIASDEANGTWGYNAFDGNLTDNNSDKWWNGKNGAGAGVGYLILDLGDVYNFTRASLLATNSGDREMAYDVYAISDLGGIEFKAENKEIIAAKIRTGTKFIANQKHSGSRAFSSVSGVGRYILIDVTDCYTADAFKNPKGATIVEFELYGNLYDPDDDTSSEETSSEETSSDVSSDTSSDVSSDTSSDVSSDTSSETSSDSTSSDDTSSEESNFAQNKNVIASGANAGYGPEKAVDGTTAGRQWMAGGVQTATAWIAVDLGQIRNFNTLKTYLGTGSSGQRKYTYDVYVADTSDFTGEFSDANKTNVFEGIKANGTKVFTVDASNSAAGEVTSIFSAIDGQYVLINFTGCVGTYDASDTISLYELEIFSTSSEDDNTSSDSTSSDDTSSDNTSSGDTSSDDTSSETPSRDKVMLKQHLGKTRTDNSVQLSYEVFTFQFGTGNTAIKPNTTYKFSFEYYSFKGAEDKGVKGSTAFVKTSKAGEGYVANASMALTELANKGRQKVELEFTTYGDQTTLYLGLETGHFLNSYGLVYAWDFKLVETGTDANLIENENFYGEWSDYAWGGAISPNSKDGLGAYAFVPFDAEIAALEYGKVLGQTDDDDDDNTSSDNTSSDTSSDSTSSDTSSDSTSSDDSTDSQSDKMMIKMELGKLRGTMNKLEWHVFPFRFAEGNTAIKPNTTYTFTFDYYSDPGSDGRGVNGGTYFVRAGKAGNGYNANANLTTAGTFANKGRNTATLTFTTAADQTVIYMGLETGAYATSYGTVFAWDFSLVENGKTENLIENENFYGEWKDYNFTDINPGSNDGKGAYSFTPFNEEIENLAIGEVLAGGSLDEDTSSEDASSDDTSSDDSWNDNWGDDTSSDDDWNDNWGDDTSSDEDWGDQDSDNEGSDDENSDEGSDDENSDDGSDNDFEFDDDFFNEEFDSEDEEEPEEEPEEEDESSSSKQDDESSSQNAVSKAGWTTEIVIILSAMFFALAALAVTAIILFKKKAKK